MWNHRKLYCERKQSEPKTADKKTKTSTSTVSSEKRYSISKISYENQGSNVQMILNSSFHLLLDYLPLLSLSLLCFTFTCGLGPLPWVLSNEVSFKSNSSQVAMRGISLIDLWLFNIQSLIMLYSFSQHP